MCFVPGTIIYLGNGKTKEIQDVETDDVVLTHKGNLRKVTHTFKRDVDEEIINIKTYFSNNTLKITKNHPVFVLKQNADSPSFIPAENIEQKDYLLFPIPKIDLSNVINKISIEDSVGYNYDSDNKRNEKTGRFIEGSNGRKPVKLGVVDVNDSFMRIIGSYLAEGCCDERSVLFGFGSSEEDVVEQIVKDIKNSFNLDAKIKRRDSVIEVKIHNSVLTKFFKLNFGRDGREKKLPDWLINREPECLIPLIKNYFIGDGYDSFDSIGCDSISKRLILQMRDCLLRLNILTSYRKARRAGLNIILGRVVNRRDLYHLGITGLNRIKFKEIVFCEKVIKESTARRGFIKSDYAYIEVREVKKEQYKGRVFNFEVDEDNSYCTEYHTVHNCIGTIIDEIAAVKWDIIPNPDLPQDQFQDEEGNLTELVEGEISHIKNFFLNPNTNHESFEEVFIRCPVRDLIEVNSAVLVKMFNLKEEMVEIVARDASTFTVNPNIHGMFTDRIDIIIPSKIVKNPSEVTNHFMDVPEMVVREKAAYFQYGWIAGPMPIPFGRREIVWLQKMVRTDDHYGYSPIQVLAKNLQMLLYQIESDLEYYNNNNVPKGIIGFEGSDSDEIDQFKTQWFENQRTKDEFGNWKKIMNKVPIVNQIPKFERIEFSSSEMQIIEKQKWYTKMVWASLGVTSTELGYTEDSAGSANQIVQSKVFRKKAINPTLRLLESKYNTQIVPEFDYKTMMGNVEVQKYVFKFMTEDLDEERSKAELNKLLIESGQVTINETRLEAGKDTVEWGDSPPRDWQQAENVNNFGGFGDKEDYDERQKEASDTKENMKEPEVDKGSSAEKKPETEGKALNTSDPLVLKEFEKPDSEERLKDGIITILKQNQNLIDKLITEQLSKDKLKEIKSIDSIAKQLKVLLSIMGLKALSDEIIKNNFMKGNDEAEKKLDMNIMPNEEAISYIQDYTFENIKGMTEDLENKLRQELERAFMNGDGISRIKSNVQKIFETTKHRAEAIARTETNRALNSGKMVAYKASGVKGTKEFIAKIDARTSSICRRLDGQKKGLDENFVDPKGEWSGQNPPVHCRCRSTWDFIPDED